MPVETSIAGVESTPFESAVAIDPLPKGCFRALGRPGLRSGDMAEMHADCSHLHPSFTRFQREPGHALFFYFGPL